MSEHDLSESVSDNEASPAPQRRGFRRDRFGRGISNDIDGRAPRPGEGWTKVWSTVKSWSSKAWSSTKSFDWSGNGRLVARPLLGHWLIVAASYSRQSAAADCNPHRVDCRLDQVKVCQ